MTVSYRWVQWNRHKRTYDIVMVGAAVAYLGVFVGVGGAVGSGISPPILAMRALGSLGIILLHVILCIGPIARWTDLAAPLLYNRRHLGVMFFLVALLHGLIAIGYYGGFGVRDPFSAVLAAPGSFASVSGFPFEVLGFAALLVFFVMAATSHDFWLANLGPRVWKSLHMLVYFAYALVVLHVMLGALQSERSPVFAGVLLAGVVVVSGLHIATGVRELRRDRWAAGAHDDWIDVGPVDRFELDVGVVCRSGSERIAVFRHSGGFSAVTNVCAHQAGPLGEGRIVGGCITCPWHGYQYRPEDGQSPPPYTEKIATYNVRVEGGRVLVDARANPPGTPVPPASANEGREL